MKKKVLEKFPFSIRTALPRYLRIALSLSDWETVGLRYFGLKSKITIKTLEKVFRSDLLHDQYNYRFWISLYMARGLLSEHYIKDLLEKKFHQNRIHIIHRKKPFLPFYQENDDLSSFIRLRRLFRFLSEQDIHRIIIGWINLDMKDRYHLLGQKAYRIADYLDQLDITPCLLAQMKRSRSFKILYQLICTTYEDWADQRYRDSIREVICQGEEPYTYTDDEPF